ncbi:MAG: hypothetical protein C4536_02245 [Actinobacteria bacterium]|jgi:uncharacterized membrane protein HdeD (DUF308 family)|nr:MAG: hypothetical protein C4536_02245 [Actinomycetota bacterium]
MEIDILYRSWWSYVLRGILALIFGILFLAYPGATLRTFIILLGIFLIVDGVVNLIRSIIFVFRKEPWGWTLVWGLVGLLIGLIFVNHTDFTLAFVAILAGIWVIIMGIAEIAIAIDMPPESGRGILAVFGVISLGFGIAILAWTAGTVYALMVILGIYLLVVAVMDFIIGIYVGRIQHKEKTAIEEAVE